MTKKTGRQEMAALKRQIVANIKQRRNTCISLAEEAVSDILRQDHVRDVAKYEATLRALKARFPKWVYSWERGQ